MFHVEHEQKERMSEPQKGKSRLGRGLSSLISISSPAGGVDASLRPGSEAIEVQGVALTEAFQATQLMLDDIRPNPHQPRRVFTEERLQELATSLKSNGVIQPIIVRRSATGYELIAGERRFRAAKLAGLTALPAIVRNVDAFTQAQMALVENIQREDLNPMDRAQGYRTLRDQLGLTQAELAARLGEDRSSIANFLRLLDLAEPVQALVREAKLSLGHAKLLAGVEDSSEQTRLASLAVTQELSVRNLERLLAGVPQAPAAGAPALSPHMMDLEKSIARQLGMRVHVRAAKKGKGRLVIHYASLDQFDELLNRLGVQAE